MASKHPQSARAERIQSAYRAGRGGDLLLLAEEAPWPATRAEAWIRAGEVLRKAGRYTFALEQLERGLEVAPDHPDGLREKELCLQSLALDSPRAPLRPRRVLLFSGHMIDQPNRAVPRFPAEKAGLAATAIDNALEDMQAGPDDLALTQGACGGDLVFTEACLRRGVRVYWLQPFAEPEFIQHSVAWAGASWHQRYLAAKAALAAPPRAAPAELGPPPEGMAAGYEYERCNLWLLYTALALGPDTVDFLCLWDGGGGDGPGGTAHLFREVERRGGRVRRIDPRAL